MQPVKKDGVWVDEDTGATVESLFTSGLEIHGEYANAANAHKRKVSKLLGELLDALCPCEVEEEAVEEEAEPLTHAEETQNRFNTG